MDGDRPNSIRALTEAISIIVRVMVRLVEMSLENLETPSSCVECVAY